MTVEPYQLEGVCFVCGENNADGLRLSFEIDQEKRALTSVWVPEARFQGYKGIIHGGLLATLLDEAVAKLAFEVGLAAVTGEMKIRYLKPAGVGERLTIRGRLTREKGRIIFGESEITDGDGEVVAKAEVKLVRQKK